MRKRSLVGYIVIALSCGVFFAGVSFASSGGIKELPVQSNYESSTVSLTTEGIWKIAPDELNPHRTRWLITRDLQLVGLHAVPVRKSKHKEHVEYGVEANGIYSHSVSYFRGPKDPSYSLISQFPCTTKPVSEFATPRGAHIAADAAARIWEQLLSRERIRLEVFLSHVRGDSPEAAIHSAQVVLAFWQDHLEHEWKDRALPQAQTAAWKYYWKQARAAGACEEGARPKKKDWAALMEPAPQSGPLKLLARAPAKQWGGLFSILVSLKIDKLELVGKFLIDSAAPQSVISPTFLENQGAPASLINVPLGVPTRISWSGGSGVATPAYIDQAKIGDLVLPLHDFYIHDTDFFGPPESFANCCDGILGSDFLRQYAVQFRPGKGPEVNVYSREGFHPPTSEPWVEAHFNPGREVESECTAHPHAIPKPHAKPEKNIELQGVRWDLGSEEALQFQFNPPAPVRNIPQWDLSCGSIPMARAMAIDAKDPELESSIYVPLDVGMALLGRGDFTFDLGHGRIWFNSQSLSLPVVQNHSGLKVEFVFIYGDRYLRVVSIRKGSAAEALKKAGLRPGMTLLSINTKSVDDMDTWAVDQYLSGVYGGRIAVEWQVGHGKKKTSKFAVMKLPPARS